MATNKNAPLSDKQKRVLMFCREYVKRDGIFPTSGEIAESFEVSVEAAHHYLEVLQLKGYVERVKVNSPRAYRINA